ncbi:MAG: helix-turn-helix transcriptional regulator [Micromonospora sp.]
MRNTPAEGPHQTWARYVQAIREATGLSRPAMAKRLDVSPATVWRWETGKQKPESPAVPQVIAELFGLDLDEVLTAAGLRTGAAVPRKPVPEVPLDPDVALIARRLSDPRVGEAEKTIIRATLRHLAQIAEQAERRQGGERNAS